MKGVSLKVINLNNITNKFKSNFVKNILLLTGGTASAQILSVIFLPIITRLYTPEQYGVLSMYGAVLVWVSFLGSMNYEMGIPIAKSEREAINILALSISLLIFFTSLLTIVFMLFGNDFLIIIKSDVLINFKYIIPASVLLVGLYSIFTQWAYREKNFKGITKTKFNQAITQNLISVSLGVFNIGTIGLLIGRIFGQSMGISTLTFSLITKKRYLFKKIKKKKIIWAARRYINFPLYTTPRRFLGDISLSLPVLFLTSIYGSSAAGFYSLANSIIQIPMSLIGTSISNVFYAESASLRDSNPKRVKALSNKLLKNLIIIGVFPLIILILFGPILFSFVFGKEWNDSGVYASLLSIAVFSRLIFKPISNIFDIYEKQKAAFLLNIVRIILVVMTFGISGYLSLKSYWTIGFYSLAMTIVYFLQYVLAQKIMNDEIKKHNNKIHGGSII